MRFYAKITVLAVASVFLLLAAPSVHAEEKKAEPSKPAQVPIQKTVTIAPGDTLSSIADANKTTWVRIFNANPSIINPDLINAGDSVRIPDDQEQLEDRYEALLAVAPPVIAPTSGSGPTLQVSVPTATTSVANAGNRYAWGNCTWYVFSRKPNIGSFWGNASNWIGAAQASGFATGPSPRVGAIGASGNHVVYVESTDGANVTVSEMNYGGGVGVVHYRTVTASSFYYIYA